MLKHILYSIFLVYETQSWTQLGAGSTVRIIIDYLVEPYVCTKYFPYIKTTVFLAFEVIFSSNTYSYK